MDGQVRGRVQRHQQLRPGVPRRDGAHHEHAPTGLLGGRMWTYKAELVRVTDGDTVVLNLDLGFRIHLHKEIFRLARINAPERKSAEGEASKQALSGFLQNNGVSKAL